MASKDSRIHQDGETSAYADKPEDAALIEKITSRLRHIDVDHMERVLEEINKAGPWRVEVKGNITTITGKGGTVFTDMDGKMANYIQASQTDWPACVEVLKDIKAVLTSA
ncbi:MAG: hypothetical protein GIW99_00755 [Candidatus Eremiobacteraeota bacterium]|nr:hypothetical protein [Candidatus Eremiobacteraeota bacterium]MBC5826215.1 hypothetical protein [Candidatus Eremiobacteraeota bacterium]